KISRRHCCVAMAYDRVLIRDLGSHNGVRVNGRLVQEERLQSGDELAIGPVLFRLEHEPDEPEAAFASAARPAPLGIAAGPELSPPVPQPAASVRQSSRPDSDSDLVPLDDI